MESTKQMVTSSPADMAANVLKLGGTTPEQLGKMMELQRDWEANEARKAYHKAMAAFKANPPEIEKDKTVSYNEVKYTHASLSNVTEKIGKALSEHGLSASWRVAQNGVVTVTCRVTHEQGHFEETSISAPADNSGKKNPIQQIASTVTYLQRYTLLALLGLATHDAEDDDGRGAGPGNEKISEADVESLEDHLKANEIDEVKFLAYLKIEKLEDLLKADLKKAQVAIEQAKAAKASRAQAKKP